MPNRLIKRGKTTYIAGIPSRPVVPAYCIETAPSPAVQKKKAGLRTGSGTLSEVSRPAYTSGGQATQGSLGGVQLGMNAGYYGVPTRQTGQINPLTLQPEVEVAPGLVVPAPSAQATATAAPEFTTTYEGGVVCFPEVPAVQGSPAAVIHEAINGWNGGARSIAGLDGDGFVQFRVDPRPIGVVAGLVGVDQSAAFNEATHALYAHGAVIEVVESGVVVAQAPYTPADYPLLTIARRGGAVVYYVGDWHYSSTTPSVGPAYLDAALYTTGDAIDSPVIGELSDLDGVTEFGGLTGAAPRLAGLFSEGAYGTVASSAPPLGGSFGGRLGVELVATAPRLAGIFAESAYALLVAAMPAPIAAFDGGFPQFVISTLDALAAPVVATFTGKSGSIGAIEGSAPAPAGLLADRPYAAVSGSAGGWLGYFDDGPEPGTYGAMEFMYLLDFVAVQPVVYVVVHDGLGLGDSASIVLLYDQTAYDGLLLGETASPSAIINAMVRDGLAIGDRLQTGQQALQYAVNVATGAVTTYRGFDFLGFVTAGGDTYGYRADGLYRVGDKTDDGELLAALLDLGSVDLATNVKQRMDGAYLGLRTDGEAFMRLVGDDGEEWLYRVEQRPDAAKARFGRGLQSREWRVSLHLMDASEADLQSIEFLVYAAARRWKR